MVCLVLWYTKRGPSFQAVPAARPNRGQGIPETGSGAIPLRLHPWFQLRRVVRG